MMDDIDARVIRRLRSIWNERKIGYTYLRETVFAGAPSGPEVEMRLGIMHLRVPLKAEGKVLWGFRTRMEVDAFTETYATSDFPITVTV